MNQARFQKQQREKARREKAAAKTARRAERALNAEEAGAEGAPPDVDETAVLAELAALHQRFGAGDMEFEEFEAAKAELTERLRVD
ncbi:MAG: hypothetical protein H0W46_12580 [Acidimicrobiia bacterium]|nr:hypothetical protein [Acidimicrobiia bacterium]